MAVDQTIGMRAGPSSGSCAKRERESHLLITKRIRSGDILDIVHPQLSERHLERTTRRNAALLGCRAVFASLPPIADGQSPGSRGRPAAQA